MKPIKLFGSIIAAATMVLSTGCGVIGSHAWFWRPTNHNSSTYGSVRVELRDTGRPWTLEEQQNVLTALREAERFGPRVVLVSNGSYANVAITKRELNCDRDGAARYLVQSYNGYSVRTIEVDPGCSSSSMELQTAVLHEYGHYLGLGHICRGNESGTNCSPVGTGRAVMNTGLTARDNEGPTMDSVYVGELPTWEVQELDIFEFRRVWAIEHPNTRQP